MCLDLTALCRRSCCTTVSTARPQQQRRGVAAIVYRRWVAAIVRTNARAATSETTCSNGNSSCTQWQVAVPHLLASAQLFRAKCLI